jgi:threonine aldolase
MPTEAMRQAMAGAEVGDDVYGDDPTVNRLEAMGAELLGKEDALFVPSGTFGNELALFTWCQRGTEVILGEECHIIVHEAGAAAMIAGVQTRCVPAPDGVMKPEEILRRLRRQDLHAPATSLICMENAHSSGRVVSLAAMDAVRNLAAEWGLPVHLDGARIFNAAAALGCEARDIAARADSVMCCLSKGLCAPVGSLLAGPGDFVAAARLKRKILGGGMRQAGILAAAGLISLTAHPPLLAADHGRAQKIAQGLAKIQGVRLDPGTVEINMVFFSHPAADDPEQAAKIVADFARRDIRINPPEQGLFRFVTHYWIGDHETDAVLSAAAAIFADQRKTAV